MCYNDMKTVSLCSVLLWWSQITKFMGPTWGPPGSCRPQMGSMLAPWFLLSGILWTPIGRIKDTGTSRHYNDVIMGAMPFQITSLTIVYSTVYSGADQRKHQRSASLAFVRGIHRRPGNSPHKWPVTRKMFPFDDVIMVGLARDNDVTVNG